MVVCLKPGSITYEVPAGGLVTGVVGSLIRVDVVSSFLCVNLRSYYLPNVAEGTTKQQINKTQFTFSSFGNFGAHGIGPNKKNRIQNKTKSTK